MAAYIASLFFGTFIIEDASLLAAIALVANGKLPFWVAYLTCYAGITIGDFLLYYFGYLASHVKSVGEWRVFKALQSRFAGVGEQELLSYAVTASRFLPGTRLPTYTLAGFVRFSLNRFIVINVVTVFIWVTATMKLGAVVGEIFANHWILTLVTVFAAILIFRFFFMNLHTAWRRKIFKHSWRKWMHFEFWPAWLFYIPIVPRYIYLGLKYRSFYLPFYADPFLQNAGLIGESKWDIYKYLGQDDFSLKTVLLPQSGDRAAHINTLIEGQHFQYPFVLKPDVGQRGFAVRVIKNANELAEYLAVAKFDLIIQEFCAWSHEAGVFYIRKPSEARGQIFSITDKEFPFVTGDGQTKIGDLILNDERARIIAPTYFERFGKSVDDIPSEHEVVPIATCGNHCQGAIFKNGQALKSEALLDAVEKIVKQIPDFYFGRLDIRYLSHDDLKSGQNFKVVEINAAGSEATHIWDPRTSIVEAYRTLYVQWEYLFAIGDEVKRRQLIRYDVSLVGLVRELLKLNKREKKLAVSS